MRKAAVETTIQAAPFAIRADVQPPTIDVERRMFDVVFTTGADVIRYDWMNGTRYIERLSTKPEHVRLDRLNGGAPFLDTHSAWALADVLGVIEEGSAKMGAGLGTATVRMASDDPGADAAWNKIRQRIIRNVSVGYRVYRYEETAGKDNKLPVRLATDWEPFEISAVPIGADAGAQTREGAKTVETNPCVLVTRQEGQMHGTNGTGGAATTSTTTATGAEVERTATGTEAGGTTTEPTDADRGAAAERERINGIIAGAESARLPLSFARKLIDEGVPLVVAQARILESLRVQPGAQRGPAEGPSGVRVTGADPLENVWRGIAGALVHRINPANFQLDDNARQYRGLSLLRTMEECLEQRGVRTRGLSQSEIVKLSLEYRSGLHGTSDFANVFADVANKTLRAAYAAAPQTFAPITRREGVRDFKPINRVQLGEAPNLEKVLEHGEFTRGTIAEGKESYALATFGRIFGMTRQALINDDLNAFGRLVQMFAQAARNKESDVVWAEILANGVMGDGVALFHATHGNLAGSGTAIAIDPLGAMRAALRSQKGLDGRTYLNLSARYLIVPPEKETLADQFTTAITAATGATVNPFSGRLTVIAEPRLAGGIVLGDTTIAGSATAWYGAASPDQTIDLLEYAFLEGEEGPQVETRAGFEIDGVQTKCRLDFAAKAIDYRGFYKNPGA